MSEIVVSANLRRLKPELQHRPALGVRLATFFSRIGEGRRNSCWRNRAACGI